MRGGRSGIESCLCVFKFSREFGSPLTSRDVRQGMLSCNSLENSEARNKLIHREVPLSDGGALMGDVKCYYHTSDSISMTTNDALMLDLCRFYVGFMSVLCQFYVGFMSVWRQNSASQLANN